MFKAVKTVLATNQDHVILSIRLAILSNTAHCSVMCCCVLIRESVFLYPSLKWMEKLRNARFQSARQSAIQQFCSIHPRAKCMTCACCSHRIDVLDVALMMYTILLLLLLTAIAIAVTEAVVTMVRTHDCRDHIEAGLRVNSKNEFYRKT